LRILALIDVLRSGGEITVIARTTTLSIFILLLIAAGCEDKGGTEYRSDKTEIARLLTDDSEARSIFPSVSIDTTDHISLYADGSSALGTINPEDYSVELISHKRGFVFRDSCGIDTLDPSNPCGEIELETGGRALAKIVQIHDTVECRYHIIDKLTHEVAVTKDVTLIGIQWALVAQMGLDLERYAGWAIYGIGRQRQANNYVGQVPPVDSIVLRARSGDYTYYPRDRVSYQPAVLAPEIRRDERFYIYVYTRPRASGETFFEAYVHTYQDDALIHEFAGFSSAGRFSFEVRENSGIAGGSYPQVVIELFPQYTLRDDSPGAFGTYIQSITYKLQ
jgi:hypothetical protein